MDLCDPADRDAERGWISYGEAPWLAPKDDHVDVDLIAAEQRSSADIPRFAPCAFDCALSSPDLSDFVRPDAVMPLNLPAQTLHGEHAGWCSACSVRSPTIV